MSPAIAGPMADYPDSGYDVYALLDFVPQVVRELDRPGSRCASLLAAFFGIGSPAFGGDTEILP